MGSKTEREWERDEAMLDRIIAHRKRYRLALAPEAPPAERLGFHSARKLSEKLKQLALKAVGKDTAVTVKVKDGDHEFSYRITKVAWNEWGDEIEIIIEEMT